MIDGEQKVEGEFIQPQPKRSDLGPWNILTRDPPFASYIERIFKRRKLQHAIYMGKLVDTKAMSDIPLFERVEEVLREIRGTPRYLTFYRRKREAFWALYFRMRYNRWAEFRKILGF
jgi:hypothetical protein